MDGELSRKLKEWIIAIIVPMMLVAAWWSVTTVNNQNDANRLAVICTSEQANIYQLKALKHISRDLGLPSDFEIPEVTEECRGVIP
jgi:hypothetical protein